MSLITIESLLAALDRAIKLATLAGDFLSTLKSLVMISRELYALLQSSHTYHATQKQWQCQWQWSSLSKKNKISYATLRLTTLYL
jgi:hydroxymethylglutaryl-CoA reductase